MSVSFLDICAYIKKGRCHHNALIYQWRFAEGATGGITPSAVYERHKSRKQEGLGLNEYALLKFIKHPYILIE
jgi:hypothetical protein